MAEGRRGEVRLAEVVGRGEGAVLTVSGDHFCGGAGGGVLKVGMGAGEKVRGMGGGI